MRRSVSASFPVSGTWNGSPYPTTQREKGLGTRKRSQDFRNAGREADPVKGKIHAPVSRASRRTPGWTTRGGPLGPSIVSAARRPEPARDDLAVLGARGHRHDAFVHVREAAENNPAVPERVDERNAFVLERLFALRMDRADADGSAQAQDPRADDAGRHADSEHARLL